MPPDLDVCEVLCLTPEGYPLCPKWVDMPIEDRLPKHINHLRAVRDSNEVNQLSNYLLEKGRLQPDRLQEMLERSGGKTTWRCCDSIEADLPIGDQATPGGRLWAVDAEPAKSWFTSRDANRRMLRKAKALVKYPWVSVQEQLEAGIIDRQTGKRQGCSKTLSLCASDCDWALRKLQEMSGVTVPHATPNSKDSRKRANREHYADEMDGSDRPGVSGEHSQGDIAEGDGNTAGLCSEQPPFGGAKGRSPLRMNKRTRVTPRSNDRHPWPLSEESLQRLKYGQPLDEEHVHAAMRLLCQFKPESCVLLVHGTSASYTALSDSVIGFLPICAGRDHWILSVLRKGSHAILYDPRGFRESEAGVEQTLAVLNRCGQSSCNSSHVLRSSPLYQREDGDSDVLLLIMALLLIADAGLPACTDVRFWRHLLFCVLGPLPNEKISGSEYSEQAQECLRVQQTAEELLSPPIDISTWGDTISSATLMRHAKLVTAQAQSAHRSVMQSADAASSVLLGLSAHSQFEPGGTKWRIRQGERFCSSVRKRVQVADDSLVCP